MNTNEVLRRVSAAIRKTAEVAHLPPVSPAELEEASGAYFARGGKLLRPALCLAMAHALGGKEAARRALVPALATEYFHLFTLVHDDVIDHDDLRRGERSAHILARDLSGIEDPERASEYGVATAILAGDVLFSRAVCLLSRAEGLSDRARLILVEALTTETLPALIEGEAWDTKLSCFDSVPKEEVLSSVYRNKTGVLFAFALFAGAVCAADGEISPALKRAIYDAATNIGEAFQLTDDYLGLVASEEEMGKSALSDIREGKRTYFVHFALERASEEEKALLFRTLGNKNAEEADVLRSRDLLVSYGKEEYEARIQRAVANCSSLLSLLGESDGTELLDALFERMIHRKN